MKRYSTWPSYSEFEINQISKILKSGKVNYWTGDQCKLFENEFSSYIGNKFSVAVFNGSVALELALRSFKLKKNDEVIVTSRSFIASASCVTNVGAKPIFADVCMSSGNIDINSIKQLINSKTKAIICVHLNGWACELDELIKIKKKHNLFLIEDCSQAHGAKYKDRHVGTFGDIAIWSFCQDKIISTGGEGGIISTNSKKLYNIIWSAKDHGKKQNKLFSKDYKFKYVHDYCGSNYRMCEYQAVIGRSQLKKLENWVKIRNRNSSIYYKLARKFKCLRTLEIPEHIYHSHYKVYIYIDKKFLKKNWNRDRILKKINQIGIPCFTGACPEIYKEKIFKDLNLAPKKNNNNAKKLGETSLQFLVDPTISITKINNTYKILNNFFSSVSK